ncbi:MAG: ATP-binding protein [bacterium]
MRDHAQIIKGVLQGEAVTGEEVNAIALKSAARLLASDDPDEKRRGERIEREVKGGACPECGRQYVKTRSVTRFASFEYWQPDCECESTEEERSERIRVIEDRLLNAGVPLDYRGSTFEAWDHTVDRETESAMEQVRAFAVDRKYREGSGLVLYGPYGTGKTRCAVSVLRRAAADGLSIWYQAMAELVGQFTDRDKGRKYAEDLLSRGVVLFDDFDKLASDNAWVQEQIYRVVSRLIADKKSVLITTNLTSIEDFARQFGGAVVSRLVGACQFIRFDGGDYRLRQAKERR